MNSLAPRFPPTSVSSADTLLLAFKSISPELTAFRLIGILSRLMFLTNNRAQPSNPSSYLNHHFHFHTFRHCCLAIRSANIHIPFPVHFLHNIIPRPKLRSLRLARPPEWREHMNTTVPYLLSASREITLLVVQGKGLQIRR
jgi:hypothetical protein